MVLNLLSSPSLCIRINKKLPSLRAHKEISKTITVFATLALAKSSDAKINAYQVTDR